jgi:hypothetical protein
MLLQDTGPVWGDNGLVGLSWGLQMLLGEMKMAYMPLAEGMKHHENAGR